MDANFCLIEEKSVSALVHLAEQGRAFDLIFVDGNHKFDDVLVDFTLSANICSVGGYIVQDDMWMPSIQRVAAFIRTNRADFQEVSSPVRNIAAFRRTSEDMREWHHHAEFIMRVDVWKAVKASIR